MSAKGIYTVENHADNITPVILEITEKVHAQKAVVAKLEVDLWGDDDGRQEGITSQVAETEKVIARMERDLMAQKDLLSRQIKTKQDIKTRLSTAQAEVDKLTSDLKTFVKDSLRSAGNGVISNQSLNRE